MHAKRLRQLLPAKPSSTDDEASPGPSPSLSLSSASLVPTSRARKHGQVPACEECRKRKKKCDRSRPACANCTERDLECEYGHDTEPAASPLQLERLAHITKTPGALYDLLTTLPHHDAMELLNMLREMPREAQSQAVEESTIPSPSPPPPLSSMASPPSSCPWLPSPSPLPYSIVGSLLPPASSELELELMVRHSVAYPVLLPITTDSLPVEELLAPRRLEASAGCLLEHTKSLRRQSSSDIGEAQGSAASTGPYTGLLHLSESQIQLLDQIDISKWTTLPIPNQVAVEAIALYLNNDHPVLPLFDADLFLRDLVQDQPYFCSRFLVAALLAWACQAYTTMNLGAAQYSTDFFAEAQAQWNQYSDRESVTLSSVSALQLLSMTAITHGKDDLALLYLRKGLQVGESMGLVNLAPGEESADAWLGSYTDWTKAASYVAWGTFNWVCVFSLHYHKFELEFPPRILMPGDINLIIAERDGHALPPINVEIFQASSKLWTIFAPVARAYYGQSSHVSIDESNALEFAEDIYRQLLSWADELPLSLVRCSGSSHAIFMLHIYYHAIITDVFRPLVYLVDPSRSMLHTFTTNRASSQIVYRASIRQMTRLLLSYRLEFSLEALSVLWQTCVIYVASAMVRDAESNSDEIRFFLHLCLAGLEELFLSYRVFGAITKGVIAMAVREGVLGQEEICRYRGTLKSIGNRYTAKDNRYGKDNLPARWMVDLNLALTDPELAEGGKLAAQFDLMSESCVEESE